MQIDVREAARLLSVSEKTIYRWIKRGEIPGFRVSGQYRFSRTELLEWATGRKIGVRPEIFKDPEENEGDPGIEESLRAGGIHYRVPGSSKEGVLSAVIALMSLPEDIDRRFLLDVLLSRESLGSTGIGEGLAIPHVRNPIVLQSPFPTMTLCFLETPVDFDSLDGKPVHTLFTLVSPTVRTHLRILSRLTYALRQPVFRSAVDAQADREAILAGARAVDRTVRPLAPTAPGEVQ
jgi:PTS system nitrogen regulatory IIA component